MLLCSAEWLSRYVLTSFATGKLRLCNVLCYAVHCSQAGWDPDQANADLRGQSLFMCMLAAALCLSRFGIAPEAPAARQGPGTCRDSAAEHAGACLAVLGFKCTGNLDPQADHVSCIQDASPTMECCSSRQSLQTACSKHRDQSSCSAIGWLSSHLYCEL